jgi:hypothetical protein
MNQKSFAKPSQLIVQLYVIALVLSYFIKSLLPGYLNFNSTEALSTVTEDGWCKPELQGIGKHCFSDFYNVMGAANSDSPWQGSANPAPPFLLQIYKFFSLPFWDVQYSRTAVVVYLLAGILCTFITYWKFASRHASKTNSKIFGFAVLALSSPFLIAVDRGSFQLYMLPMYFLLTNYYLDAEHRKFSNMLIILILFKPQLALLAIILVIDRHYREFLRTFFLATFFLLASFLLYPERLIRNVSDYINQLSSYQNYTNAGALFPPNLSLPNYYSTLKRFLFEFAPNLSDLDPRGKWEFWPNSTTLLISVAVVFMLLVGSKHRTRRTNFLLVLMLPIIFTNVTFAYYLCLLLPIIIIYFIESFEEQPRKDNFLNSGVQRFLFGSFLIFHIIPWAIPWTVIPAFQSFSWAKVSITWFLGQGFLLMLIFVLLSTGISKGLAEFRNRFRTNSN